MCLINFISREEPKVGEECPFLFAGEEEKEGAEML